MKKAGSLNDNHLHIKIVVFKTVKCVASLVAQLKCRLHHTITCIVYTMYALIIIINYMYITYSEHTYKNIHIHAYKQQIVVWNQLHC